VQQQKGRRPKGAHDHDFLGHIGKQNLSQCTETEQVNGDSEEEKQIINPLLAVPLYSSIRNTHISKA
jgi:hypothetical protein